jgi:hypothetical protein
VGTPQKNLPNSVLPAGPKSVVKDTADLFSSDIDNFLSVSGYGNLQFDKLWLFLGGATASGLTGGVATKIGNNYFAFYTNGMFFPVGGSEVLDEDDLNNGQKYEDRTSKWNNIYSFLWGSPALGGLRLDFAFNDSPANSNSKTKNGNTVTQNQTFVTAVRWSGLKFGDFSLKPTLAIQWPSLTKTVDNSDTPPLADDTVKEWKDAALDLKLEAGYGKIGASYELLANFGETTKGHNTIKGYKQTKSGYAVNTLTLDYTVTYDADEKIQFKAKPKLTMALYTKSNKTKTETEAADTDADNGSETAFMLTPTVDLGVSWKLLPKLTFYTGTKITPFELTTESSKKGDDGGHDGKKSYLSGALLTGLNFGLAFNPSSILGIEFSVTNSNANFSTGSYNLNIVSYNGKFAVKVKL